ISSSSDLVVNGTLDLNGYDLTVASLSGAGSIVNSGVSSYSVVTDNLILYLDASNSDSAQSSSISTWYDLSGSGNHATFHNGSATVTDGKVIFDGQNNSYFTIPSTDTDDFTSGFTIIAGFEFDSNRNWERIIDFGNGASSSNILFARSATSNNLSIWCESSGCGSNLTSSGGISNGSYKYYSATMDGSNHKIYVDTTLLASNNNTSLPSNTTRNTNYIGRSHWGYGDPNLKGEMGALLIYNGALTSSQLTQTINALNDVSSGTTSTLTVSGSSSTNYTGIIDGSINLTKAGSGTLTLSGTNTYTGQTNINAGIVKLTGALSASTDLSIASGATLDLQSTQTFATLDLDGTITRSAGSSALTITGASDLGGSVTTSGSQTYTGAITLTANTTLTSTSDAISASTIDGGYDLTITAGAAQSLTSAIGSSTALTSINVSTTSGNLTLGDDITVTGTGTDAMIFNAGSSTAAGTSTGGNIIISSSPTFTTGSGGRMTYYTGSISGSTGLTSLIGSGSNRFRYNSDETTTNYSAALSSGKYAIYREQPTLTITADDETVTYSNAPSESVTITGMQNGDASATVVTTDASISISGDTSTSGNYIVGDHTITPSAAASTYGYGFSYSTGTLTVNAKALSVISIASVTATYGDSISNGSVTFANAETGDLVSVTASTVSATYSTSSNLKAGTYNQVTGDTSDLTGADAANYTLTATTEANSLTVSPKALTIAGITASNKTYNGNTTATTDVSAATFSGLVVGDDVTVSATGTFDNKNVGTGKTVTLVETNAGDDVGNYTITDQGSTTANITQLSSVTWNGNAGDGLWSSASNWAGSAIPDQNNVATAVIPSDESVTFDSDTVGTIGSTITNSGTLTFNGATDYTFGQVISGSGALVKSNTNTLTLSATNTFTGDTTISAG
ncbi:YDG domain-containing protein, partial [Candidatus Pelagibacter ubique]|nr:YDG domain-containing protein [Candidatus Pelagibacter ubique]